MVMNPQANTQALAAQRGAALIYGVAVYFLFFATFLYLIGFVEGVAVPKSLTTGPAAPWGWAVLVNVGLIALFGVQHSIMARPGFKRWWTGIVHPALERSTFVLATVAMFALMFSFWQPMPQVLWEVQSAAGRVLMYGVSGLGWGLVLVSTVLINHFDLFGLRQTWLYFRGRPYTPVKFRKAGAYRHVRHPLMTGFLIAFWTVPTMTAGGLLFALVYTGYILIALRLEERDLIAQHGEAYLEYQRTTPGLIPRLPVSKTVQTQ